MKFKLSKYVHLCEDKELFPNEFILYATRTGAAAGAG